MPREKRAPSPGSLAFKKEVARSLQRYRNAKGLTNAAVAKLLGIDEGTLTKYLNEEIQMGGEILARALTDLGISLRYGSHEITASPVGEPRPHQLSFVFDTEIGPSKVEVQVERQRSNQVDLNIRFAG